MDMTTAIITICVSVIGSSALATLIQFFVSRADKKHDKFDEIYKRLDKIDEAQKKSEKDSVRMQLILMMSNYPEQEQEIIMLAEHYFSKHPNGLGGNWYATSLFNRWLKENNIAEPCWFDNHD